MSPPLFLCVLCVLCGLLPRARNTGRRTFRVALVSFALIRALRTIQPGSGTPDAETVGALVRVLGTGPCPFSQRTGLTPGPLADGIGSAWSGPWGSGGGGAVPCAHPP